MWGEAKRDLASVDSKKPKGEVVASLPSYRKIESLDLLALLLGSGGKPPRHVCSLNLCTINRLIVTESYFWRLTVAESRTMNMDSLDGGDHPDEFDTRMQFGRFLLCSQSL